MRCVYVRNTAKILAENLNGMAERYENIEMHLLDELSLFIKTAKDYTPWQTGWLHDSYSVPEVERTGDGFIATVINDADYSAYVEVGTRYMTGRFYMWRAWTEHLPRLIYIVDRVLNPRI